jgi:hypothetical protein
MIMNTTVPQGEQKSPTIGIRATTSGFSHQQIHRVDPAHPDCYGAGNQKYHHQTLENNSIK